MVCDPGTADCVVSFETTEALRNLPFLAEDGYLLVADEAIKPLPVATGRASMPAHARETLADLGATLIPAGELAREAGSAKSVNVVLLGALSTRGGQRLAGVRRHPTIEDDVTIYSNASVLGGETVIGRGSVIAGSAFVTSAIPPHSRVSLKAQEITVRQPGERD